MKFSLSVKKYFPSERSKRVKYFSTKEDKLHITVSPNDYVIFFLLYKILTIHQKTKKPQEVDSAQKYCELIGQMCDLLPLGIQYCTTKFYIITSNIFILCILLSLQCR